MGKREFMQSFQQNPNAAIEQVHARWTLILAQRTMEESQDLDAHHGGMLKMWLPELPVEQAVQLAPFRFSRNGVEGLYAGRHRWLMGPDEASAFFRAGQVPALVALLEARLELARAAADCTSEHRMEVRKLRALLGVGEVHKQIRKLGPTSNAIELALANVSRLIRNPMCPPADDAEPGPGGAG
jgi:hypothetical protein